MIIADQQGDFDWQEFLERPLFAFLATFDGKFPNVSPVWFLFEDQVIWIIAHRKLDTFPKRIQNHPACSIAITELEATNGRMIHIGFRGHAEVLAWQKQCATKLLSKYLGASQAVWPERYVQKLNSKNMLLVRFEPNSAVIRDQSFQYNLLNK